MILTAPAVPTLPGTTRPTRGTGLALAASGVLSAVGSGVLAAAFGWPGVLDERGTTALPAFAAAETAVRAGFVLMLVSSVLIVPAAYGLEQALARPGAAARALTTFGVAGALFQVLGWVRWPVTVPVLSDAYAAAPDEAGRTAVAASYDVLNHYAGGAVGEQLGWLFQGVWAVGVGVLVLRAVGVPRWFAVVGLALASLWAVLVPLAGFLGSPALDAAGQPAYALWYVWLLALGVVLVLRTVRRRD